MSTQNKCPRCGELNGPKAMNCVVCFAGLPQATKKLPDLDDTPADDWFAQNTPQNTPKPKPAPSAPKKKFCPDCGNPIQGSVKFCANCGTNLYSGQTAQQAASPPPIYVNDPPANPEDEPSKFLNVASFLFPIVGFFAWIMLSVSGNTPRRAAAVGRNTFFGFLFGFGVWMVLLWMANDSNPQGTYSVSSSPSFGSSHTITYRVSGTAQSVSLTFQNSQGGTEQIQDAPVPWSQTFQMNSGDFAYISAQNQGESGSVTVEILLDGEVAKTSTSSGAYTITDASGVVE